MLPLQELPLTGATVFSLRFRKRMVFLSPKFQNTIFFSQKHVYPAQHEVLSLVKKENENVRHYALKFETLGKQAP